MVKKISGKRSAQDSFEPKRFKKDESTESVESGSTDSYQKDVSYASDNSESSDDETNINLLSLLNSLSGQNTNKIIKQEVESLPSDLRYLYATLETDYNKCNPTLSNILSNDELCTTEKQHVLNLYKIWKETTPDQLEYITLRKRILFLTDTTITIKKIESALLTRKEKDRGIELYNNLDCYTLYSPGWYEIYHELSDLLSKQGKTKEEIKNIENETEEFKQALDDYHDDILKSIFNLDADKKVKSKIYAMYQDWIQTKPSQSRYLTLKEKLQWCVKLPYRKVYPLPVNEDRGLYLKQTLEALDQKLYGMKDVKLNIMQIINDRLNNNSSMSLLALKGPAGVGKTRIAQATAEVLGLPFEKISLGGMIDSTVFHGSESVWSGAGPSLLLKIISRLQYANGIVLLDELDKLTETEKGLEVQHSLLHILDPNQNKDFQDLFLCEFNHDISSIWFMVALNDDSKLQPALKDRLNILEVEPYTTNDYVNIAKDFLLPLILKEKGLKEDDITLDNDAVRGIIKSLGVKLHHGGVRPIKDMLSFIISRISLLHTLSKENNNDLPFELPNFTGYPYNITAETVNNFVKPKRSTTLSYYM